MGTVTVSFEYDPEPEEADEKDRSGVTSEEFDRLNDVLLNEFGAQEINVVAKS